MTWTAWIASKHALIVHLPIAAALMIPFPIMAAQRGGRGIRPWWNTCRYLAWFGTVGSILAALSGVLLAQHNGTLAAGALWAPAPAGFPYLFRTHELGGAASILLGALCLRFLYLKRQDHQGIGFPALLAGLAWCCASYLSSYSGAVMLGRRPAPDFFIAPPQLREAKAAPAPVAPPAPVAEAPRDLEAQAPLRALNYLALKAIHGEPVRSAPHGNRWIRVWVNPEAEKAYVAGEALPPGSLVVMSTLEDRWGRPGYDSGPLYALEITREGKSRLTFHWPQVPELHRSETQGEAAAYWRGDDPKLQGCLACHAHGAAPAKDRSRVVIPRKPKVETPAAG
jgi:hypothetical protein